MLAGRKVKMDAIAADIKREIDQQKLEQKRLEEDLLIVRAGLAKLKKILPKAQGSRLMELTQQTETFAEMIDSLEGLLGSCLSDIKKLTATGKNLGHQKPAKGSSSIRSTLNFSGRGK